MKVFISHSSKDKYFVKKLKQDLEANYISTWLDQDEMDIGDSLSEKLEEGIDESSHFIIVLSPNSIKSEWVSNELKKALKGSQKIIPIKYRDCEVPSEIAKLLYIDLSKEVVEIKGEKVEFITKGYSNALSRLVNDVRKQKYKLTESDKKQIQKEIKEPKKQERLKELRVHLKVSRLTSRRKKKWIKALNDIGTENPVPVMLPPLFKGLKLGDNLNISSSESVLVKAHFAVYRKDNLKIGLPGKVIRNLLIEKHEIYAFEFNKKSKAISIL